MNRLLIVGFGDVARRASGVLARRFQIARLSRAEGQDLDVPQSLRLEPCDALLHLAPPPVQGETDTRTAHLLDALETMRILPARVVYVSTSGVYGDCGGAIVDESRPLAPQSGRARRRADAERRLAHWCEEHGSSLVILRAPGIYARERLPLERLRAGTPVLRAEDDVYTNHVHADDLAAIVCRALEADAPAGVYNASDDTEMKMGDWFDLVADRFVIPRPPRISRAVARETVPEPLYSFMRESRRLDNRRLKHVLGVRLRFATVHEGLEHEHPSRLDQPA